MISKIYIQKLLNLNINSSLTFINVNENEKADYYFPKLNELNISHLSKLSLNFPYYKNIDPNNILEFSYDVNISSINFTLINKFQNLTHLKLINNIKTFKALINFFLKIKKIYQLKIASAQKLLLNQKKLLKI